MKKIFSIFFLNFFLVSAVFATHMRAGEITYRHITGFKYEITIITYTYTPSPADRPSYTISWGDNSTSVIQRISKTTVGVDISENKYVGDHTYSGPDTYVISLEDPNRNGGIMNIPNSINVPFYIQPRRLRY